VHDAVRDVDWDAYLRAGPNAHDARGAGWAWGGTRGGGGGRSVGICAVACAQASAYYVLASSDPSVLLVACRLLGSL